jgi:hypothetical protein
MENCIVNRYFSVIGFLAICLVAASAVADTFTLTDGETISGEVLVASANDAGAQIKVGEGEYKRVSWANFSQEDLKKFAKIPKLQAFVEPFIEISREEKIKRTEFTVKQPPRLERPTGGSLFGALFSSALGLSVLLALYGANIYSAYEIASFRGQPPALVCGVAAVLPVAGPIIFLSMPTKLATADATWETAPAPAAEAEARGATLNPMLAEGAAHPAGLKLADTEVEKKASELPATTTFQRGQFTFNRRFFETKFPGFFGVVRRDTERDLVLVMKTTRGEYAGQRISRIAANDLHLQVQRGHASEEVLIPFQDIQEIQLKHKDSK